MLHRLPLLIALGVVLLSHAGSWGNDPNNAVASALRVQRAMSEAQAYLTANRPHEAVLTLEEALPYINGNAEFLGLLQQAYRDELKRLKLSRIPDARRMAEVEEKLGLLPERGARPAATAEPAPPASAPPIPTPELTSPFAPVAASAPAAPPAPAAADLVQQASEMFRQARTEPAKYAAAAGLFAQAIQNRVELTPAQVAAWAYCRVRVAAERLNATQGNAAVAQEVAREVTEALALAPHHQELQLFGRSVLAAAGASAGAIPAKAEQPLPVPQVTATTEPATPEDTWQALEYGSFRVRHQGNRNLAEEVARRAEEHRIVIFQRWSGPPGGTWNPLCEIVLHPSAAAFAEATRQPIEATGHAHVKLETGRATERRIDLRVDDDTLLDNALPRELTHIVLGDLFPANAPPRWATDAMAVLATSPTEIERYLRTVPRCEQSGGLIPLGQLLEMKDLPQADQITAYAVESVSLVDFLVRWKKEKAFTTFLRDCQRYGTASALKRQYGITSPQQLEKLWRENVLTSR